MKLSGNTVLVTGGATGIGLSIATRFLDAGSRVVICARNKEQLEWVRTTYPAFETIYADIGGHEARESLVNAVIDRFGELNVLVNNAGIQRRVDLLADKVPWSVKAEEVAVNFEAPVHLAMLLAPYFLQRERAAIINVTSGLAFIPSNQVAVYAATKAALHSFTLTLRSRLQGTSVSVVEVIPPAVNTDLGGAGVHAAGVSIDAFTGHVMARLETGDVEIGYGTSERFRTATREEAEAIFREMNAQM
ncbi:SDR family oxidoreductase [Serratia marcescens]|uniref:SDR family oxidoreductase n=1 Tax=Serratia marcescens TaxID=615 RepID=UPI003D6F3942